AREGPARHSASRSQLARDDRATQLPPYRVDKGPHRPCDDRLNFKCFQGRTRLGDPSLKFVAGGEIQTFDLSNRSSASGTPRRSRISSGLRGEASRSASERSGGAWAHTEAKWKVWGA